TQWKSDMAWGAAEIVLADEAPAAPAAQLSAGLATAARWARAYIAQGHPAAGDTFNLYDNGAVAEADLLQAMRNAPGRPAIAPAALLADHGRSSGRRPGPRVGSLRWRCSTPSPRSCGSASTGPGPSRSGWARPSEP